MVLQIKDILEFHFTISVNILNTTELSKMVKMVNCMSCVFTMYTHSKTLAARSLYSSETRVVMALSDNI